MAELENRDGEGTTDRVVELDLLDPGTDDGLYWARFHREVMARAGAELARRRDIVHVTMADALTGWARLIVPVSAAAAALAAFMLVRSPEAQTAQVRVDDILDVPSALAEEPEVEFAPTFSAVTGAESF